MSESEPKTKTIWVCPQCGWVRPNGYSSKNCGKCGATLIRKIVKEDCPPTEMQIASNVYAQPCEMHKICPLASKACHESIPYTEKMRTIPARRWIDCWAYKTKILGLTFNKELGIYHLERCPVCNFKLTEYLKLKLKEK